MLFRCRIPIPHHGIKKNSRQIMRGAGGQPFIGKSKSLSVIEKVLTQRLTICRLQQRIDTPISTDVSVKMIFFFKNYWIKPKNKKELTRRSKTLGDLSNLYQLPEDCLQLAGIIADDAQIQSHDGSRILPGSENELLIEITSYDLNNELIL